MHRDTIDQQVLALIVGLCPESRIHHRHTFYLHILAFAEIDQLRTVGHTSQLQFVLDHPWINLVDEVIGKLTSTTVDHPFAGDTDIILLIRQDQAVPGIQFHIIIIRIGGTDQHGTLSQMDRHIWLQMNTAGQITSDSKHQTSSPILGNKVDRLLYGTGIHGRPIRLDPEHSHLVIFCPHRHQHSCQQAQDHYFSNHIHNSSIS